MKTHTDILKMVEEKIQMGLRDAKSTLCQYHIEDTVAAHIVDDISSMVGEVIKDCAFSLLQEMEHSIKKERKRKATKVLLPTYKGDK